MENELGLGYMFKLIHILFEGVIYNDLKELDITPSQANILVFLYNNREMPITHKNVERHFGLSNPTVTGVLKRMEEKGLIERAQSRDDGRAKAVALTDKSMGICEKLLSDIQMRDGQLLNGLTQEEKNEFSLLLNKVYNNLKN